MIVDARTNTLILKELPTNMDTVIAVIENLDIPEPQVMIEARIVETRKNFTRTLGINWSFLGAADAAHGNTTGLVFPATATSSGGVNLVTGGSTGFLNLALGTLSGAFHLDAALQAAENEGLINILSAPKVATLNNERASIQSGFQIPIQTVANNTVSVQFVNATLRLDVTPQVTAEGTIKMQINIQKRNPEFALQVAGASAAPISTKEAQTQVIVRDGGTTVIGGIYEVSTNAGEDRVPGLANVPILGHLFKNRRREDSTASSSSSLPRGSSGSSRAGGADGMHKTVATLIGVVAMVAVLGCSSSVDKTDGTVFIFVSTIPTLPGSISVNDTAAGTGFLTINSLSIQSRAKDPNAVTSALQNVELRTYEVVYSRVDGAPVCRPRWCAAFSVTCRSTAS